MTVTSISPNWISCIHPNELQQIHQKEINLAFYDRDISELQAEINHFLTQPIEIRASGEIDIIIQQIQKELTLHQLILNDVIDLLNIFKELTTAKMYRLFLATVNTNMCRKFHTDINDLRLLCTYRGSGTLWVEDDYVNRRALESCGDNECVVLDETKVHQVNTGTAAILKGAIYPIEGTKAIVHRSPTIEESGEKRLLLRIDTNEFLNFD